MGVSLASSRPSELRDTPRFDRSGVGMHWTEEWRYQAVDLFCGRGGVGRAFAGGRAPKDPWTFAGFDHEDYADSYPGEFYQRDLIPMPSVCDLAEDTTCSRGITASHTVPTSVVDDEHGLPTNYGLTADVVWVSWPCTAYSSLSPTHYGSREAALEACPRITDDVRERLLEIAPHYVIENVPGATRVGDLDANVRVNGLAFGKPFDLERHFETTFPVPDAYLSGEPEVPVDTRGDQSVQDLAEAKNVPASWGKQGVRSAIPQEYVEWILHHCPSFPTPKPKRVRALLAPQMQNGLGIVEN
jgi:hypothetical protein